jgi:hypothetical protein
MPWHAPLAQEDEEVLADGFGGVLTEAVRRAAMSTSNSSRSPAS